MGTIVETEQESGPSSSGSSGSNSLANKDEDLDQKAPLETGDCWLCWGREKPEGPKEKDIDFRIREQSVNQVGDLVFVFPERLRTLDHFNLTEADLRHGGYFELHFHSNVQSSLENGMRIL